MSHVTDIADKNQNVAPASFEKEDKLRRYSLYS